MQEKIKMWLWRWALRRARLIMDAADERIHAEEVKLRERLTPAAPVAPPIEFDRVASAAREKVHKTRAARPRMPRLRYQAGQWVRQ